MNIGGLGGRIKELRKSRRLTQGELCNGINAKYNTSINKGMISKWENNKERPRLEFIVFIAGYFNTDAAYILGTNENTFQETDEIDTIINLYIPNIISFLKDTCKKFSIQSEKLTDEYLMLISSKIASNISERIDYDFYDDILEVNIKNSKKYQVLVTINDIRLEIEKSKVFNQINRLIEDEIIRTFYNIHDFINDVETSKATIENMKDSKCIAPLPDLENDIPHITQIFENIENIENVKFILDMSNDIIKIIENSLFHNIFKEVISYFIEQLNTKGQEMAFEYIKYLLTNDEHKKSK